MTEPRVHVNVLVTKSLAIGEPQWCTGHRSDRAHFKDDISHSGPEQTLTFRGETLWTLQIVQSPFSASAGDRRIGLYVEQGGYARTLDPRGLDELADALVEQAAELRSRALHLASLRDGGER